MRDSAIYYINLEKMSKYYNESLMKPSLFTFEVLNRDERLGLYDLHFLDYLYVVLYQENR